MRPEIRGGVFPQFHFSSHCPAWLWLVCWSFVCIACHSRAQSASSAVGWGYYNLAGFPADTTNIVSIAIAGSHSLALKSDGTLVAYGSIGNNPADVPTGLTGVTAIAVSSGHNLALKSDGTVEAWGLGQPILVYRRILDKAWFRPVCRT